ncbi:PLP-dependent transferase [Xylaria palmicola]|nr:PLP-dependent transferase [Xylaria palmicola]
MIEVSEFRAYAVDPSLYISPGYCYTDGHHHEWFRCLGYSSIFPGSIDYTPRPRKISSKMSLVRMSGLDATLQGRLERRETQGKLRHLVTPRPDLADFSSNDYLSLSHDPAIRKALISHLNDTDESPRLFSNGRVIGSGGSRLLDGNSVFAERLERKIADFHGSEDALLFTSAYDANVGIISCVPGAEDIILYDDLIHASIHDGMRLSRARKRIAFSHGSIIKQALEQQSEKDSMGNAAASGPQSLELTLKQLVDSDRRVRTGQSNVFICVEGLYSMDGDIADLKYVTDVVEAFLQNQNGYIIVDEAHSIGVLGGGGGLVCQLGLRDRIWARVVGFGKAMGCAGGAVLCSSIARLYLINYARTLIYTTAMPFPSLASIDAAYDYMAHGKAKGRRQQLGLLIQHCYAKLDDLGKRRMLDTTILRLPKGRPNSPIIPLFTGHPKSLARHCQLSGFMIRAIVAPTVPRGQERIRICIHASNTMEQIDGLFQAIEIWLSNFEAEQEGKPKEPYPACDITREDLLKNSGERIAPKL